MRTKTKIPRGTPNWEERATAKAELIIITHFRENAANKIGDKTFFSNCISSDKTDTSLIGSLLVVCQEFDTFLQNCSKHTPVVKEEIIIDVEKKKL